mgnify:CR=1 FL=1
MKYMDYCLDPHCDMKLTDIEFHTDSKGYYVSVKYRVESDRDIREIDIPKIRLPINPNLLRLRTFGQYSHQCEANIGFGYLPCEYVKRDGHDIYFTETVIEEKTHEMTLDEIEKELGYKVKIVNKKE